MRLLYVPTIAVWVLILLWSIPHFVVVIQSDFAPFVLGKSIAGVLIPTVVAYIAALILWFISGRSRLASTIAFFVTFLLLALVQIIGRLGSSERIQKQAIEDPFSTSKENCTKLTRAWPMLKSIEDRLGKDQKVTATELKKLDAEINDASFSDFTLMSTKEAVTKRRKTLESYLALWKKVAEFIESPAQSALPDMKAARIPEEGIRRVTLCLKKGLTEGLEKTPIKSAERYLALSVARQEETSGAIELYSILESNWGNWEVDSGVPVLRDPSVMDSYNLAIAKTERATSKAAAVLAEAGASQSP